MQARQRGKLAIVLSPPRLVGTALALFAALIWWSWDYPRLVAGGGNPPALVGEALVVGVVTLLIAALVSAIADRSRIKR